MTVVLALWCRWMHRKTVPATVGNHDVHMGLHVTTETTETYEVCGRCHRRLP